MEKEETNIQAETLDKLLRNSNEETVKALLSVFMKYISQYHELLEDDKSPSKDTKVESKER